MPCVLESYKTYDDNVLIKTADIGQVLCYSCYVRAISHKSRCPHHARHCPYKKGMIFALMYDI